MKTRLVAAGLVAAAATLTIGTGTAAARPTCDAGQALIRGIDTASSGIAICQYQGDGRLRYHGMAKSNGNTIDLPAYSRSTPRGTVYYAINNGYEYDVYADGLTILAPGGAVMSSEPAL
ncbi:hypothetical protein P0W64_11590 [Tsukamurella sp. 8F]|uniref:hypothetical protein n=1 Tax=unclassified Tsukamurella TaxID=2633480 RepID=UPI0023B9E3B0|nr:MULTISPECIES: hypothetical protein [unclassified Tsukamurella]MDF0529041.1 hypothetical protein [Tsukamurella sp. 8J]MDF0587414.1 hypothetical protein [Tsukamurella sp. 8F]